MLFNVNLLISNIHYFNRFVLKINTKLQIMNKLILVTGATGMIGSKLTKKLSELGYSVGSISRNPNKSKSQLPWCQFHIDYNKPDELKDYISKSYGVINLAGASIADKKWTPEYKKEILDSRINSTKMIVDAINLSPNKPKVLINGSAIGIYGNTADKEIDEKSPTGNGFLAEVTVRWENEAKRLNSNVRLVLARTGVVLDENGGALEKMIMPFKFFVGGPIGSGRQWLSWIHIDDLVNLFIWSIENPISGPINFTAPNPVIMSEFAKELGKVMSRPSIFPVPEFVLKLILGESSAMVTNSNKVIPKVALENNFKFTYINLNSALKSILG